MIKVQKRDGRIVNYDREKIVRAIQKANAEVDAAERAGEALIDGILDDVEKECEDVVHVESIQDMIEGLYCRRGVQGFDEAYASAGTHFHGP